jgi:hypothetical protein
LNDQRFTRILVGDVVALVDVEATRAAYAVAEPDLCECWYCRNLKAQFANRVLPSVAAWLDLFAIDWRKCAEIFESTSGESPGLDYWVDWWFVGELEKPIPGEPQSETLTDSVKLTLSETGCPPQPVFREQASAVLCLCVTGLPSVIPADD